MYGLEAISDAGGWQMAALGVAIVFTSLVFLSIIISQLHKVLDFWEKPRGLRRSCPSPETEASTPEETLLPHPDICPEDIGVVAAIWAPLVEQLEDPFTLTELYRHAARNNFPHPHLTINRLRQAGILVPVENCRFSWKQA